MNLDLLTRDDLHNFKNEILNELKGYFKPNENENWLKSLDVKEMLGCSDSTLQKHRIKGRIPYKKLCGTYYYKKSDIEKVLNNNSGLYIRA